MISKEVAEQYKWGNNSLGWHLAKTESLSVIEELVPPGESEIMHYHTKAEQFFFVLSGTATIDIDGERHVLSTHQGVHVPPCVAHQLANLSQEDLCFLVISTPPSHGDRVEI